MIGLENNLIVIITILTTYSRKIRHNIGLSTNGLSSHKLGANTTIPLTQNTTDTRKLSSETNKKQNDLNDTIVISKVESTSGITKLPQAKKSRN